MNSQINDVELIGEVAKGNRQAFAIFYQRYTPNLYRYIFAFCRCKETAEEIVQDVFLKIWANRSNLLHIESPKSYVYRCAKNLLLNQIRRTEVETRVLKLSQNTTGDTLSADFADEKVIYSQYARIAQDAIDKLPEKRRKIFQLRTEEDLSLDEIAEQMSISKSVVKKQLYSGRDFVREYLGKAGVLGLSGVVFFLALSI